MSTTLRGEYLLAALMVTSSTYQNVMSKRLLFLSVNFVIKIKYLTIEFNKIIDFYFVFIISF